MNSTIFIRPNLKVLLLAAVLIAVVQHLITNVHSQAQSSRKALPVHAREISDQELENLVKAVGGSHNPELYMRISHLYEQKGDYKRALLFLRRAEKLNQADIGHE